MTNADRIRAMTDEELLDFIIALWNEEYRVSRFFPKDCDECYGVGCTECWNNWLKEGASE